MKRFWTITILFIIISHESRGTGQFPDLLIYDNDTISIYSNPLEIYFEDHGRPSWPLFKDCVSTACWRGYIAIWELRNDSLFLKQINSCDQQRCGVMPDEDLKELFGSKCMNGEVFADWVSYEVISPFGQLLQYIHQGYDSIFEFERGFLLDRGQLVDIHHYDNRKTRNSSLRSQPDSLHQFFYEAIDWSLVDPDQKLERKFVVVSFHIDSNERPADVRVTRGIDPKLDKEAARVVSLLPEWDVYYRRGEVVKVNWSVPVYFDQSFYH